MRKQEQLCVHYKLTFYIPGKVNPLNQIMQKIIIYSFRFGEGVPQFEWESSSPDPFLETGNRNINKGQKNRRGGGDEVPSPPSPPPQNSEGYNVATRPAT